MDFSKLTQIQLSSETPIKPFKCAEDDLNGFLFEDAKHFQEQLMAVTYLIEDTGRGITVAYFSLLADKITFNPEEKSVWNKLNRNIPNLKRRRSYPAVKIGRLAVNEEYAGAGMGTFVLDSKNMLLPQSRGSDAVFSLSTLLIQPLPSISKTDFNFLPNRTKEMKPD